MSKREDEKYADWIAEVSEELPEEQREAFAALAESDVAKERFYRGTIRQDDYYRRLNEVDGMKKELEGARDELYTWYEEETPKQDALIEERDLLKKQLADKGDGGEPPAASNSPGLPGFSAEDLADLRAKANKIDALDKIMPAVMADMGAIAKDAWENGFDYDPHEIMRTSLQSGVAPYKAYEDATSDQRKARYEKAEEDQRNKWIEEGKRQALTARTGSPDALSPSGPVWERLENKDETKETTQQDRVNQALEAMLEEGMSVT